MPIDFFVYKKDSLGNKKAHCKKDIAKTCILIFSGLLWRRFLVVELETTKLLPTGNNYFLTNLEISK
jgi:hypothetical protein